MGLLRVVAINCTLKRSSGEPSSTEAPIDILAQALGEHGAKLSETIRVADHDVKPGVTSDEGDGDAWQDLRRRILSADVLIFGTPIWLGQPSSIAKRVLERMDAFHGETDDRGRMPSFGKIAVAAIVGNEDGAHRVAADLFQALNDVGWTIPAGGACYWVGEAMQKTDFKDLRKPPETVLETAHMLAANAAHLARLLQKAPYPGVSGAGG
jgi:multimeric flavodoxin WrbA